MVFHRHLEHLSTIPPTHALLERIGKKIPSISPNTDCESLKNMVDLCHKRYMEEHEKKEALEKQAREKDFIVELLSQHPSFEDKTLLLTEMEAKLVFLKGQRQDLFNQAEFVHRRKVDESWRKESDPESSHSLQIDTEWTEEERRYQCFGLFSYHEPNLSQAMTKTCQQWRICTDEIQRLKEKISYLDGFLRTYPLKNRLRTET